MKQTSNNGALQAPLGSGFTAASTAGEVIGGISLAGKVAIVTGGYTGIGLETTKTWRPLARPSWCPREAWRKPRKIWRA